MPALPHYPALQLSMPKCDKLLEKAKASPNNLSYRDLCDLAECFGFVFLRQSGSHAVYENMQLDFEHNRIMNFQNFKGKAKAYQVRQLLKAIRYLNHEE